MDERFLTMRRIIEILRLSEEGIKKTEIKRASGASFKAIRSYIAKASALNLAYSNILHLSEEEVYKLFFPAYGRTIKSKPQPEWNYIHSEMQKKNVTLQLLWEEFLRQNQDGCGYSQFCFHYENWKKKNINLSMRQSHKPGEKCFVDYAGHTIPITNQDTGEVRYAQIFVCTLGASNYTFANATWTQSLPDWIDSHIKAFEYFGGVPEIAVIDNLKSGVNKSCRYEPEINKTYHDFAMHYGIVVVPTRARKPKDKAKVEVAVQIVERWILACLRNQTFFSLSELNTEISRLLEKLNSKQFKKLNTSRKQLFEEKEKPLLKQLPERLYELCEWKKARVNIDYHIELNDHYYSVPYKHVSEEVELCFNSKIVSIYRKNIQIALHARRYEKGKYSTLMEHMPKAHQEYLKWDPTRIINWAGNIGPNTKALIQKLLESKQHPAQGYRSAIGIIRFEKVYGKERMENAAKRALTYRGYSYHSIKSILKKGLDKEEIKVQIKERQDRKIISIHENIRGPEYFSVENTIKMEEKKCQ